MASEAIRDCIADKPISTDPSRAEGVPGFGSRGMELQKVTFRYKRGLSVSAMMTCIGEFARKRPDEITWPRHGRPAGNR
jgi:hypothetical protein